MAKTRIEHLKELSNSDYKIADDQPNINDWKIVDNSGKRVGKVKDLLFDKEAKRVRYIITDLNDGEILKEDRKVLIPIGKAKLNKKDERVIMPNITRDNLSALPAYTNTDALTQEDEHAIRNSISGTGATGSYNRETFYNHDDFDEDRFYDEDNDDNRMNTKKKVDVIEEDLEVGKREVNTGGARVTSRIVERPVEERVNLREEQVEVNRNRVDRPVDNKDLDNFEEDTIEMTETTEKPVVNKEARVVEEISLNKDVTNREQVIKDKVRKTEIDIDKTGDRTGKREGHLNKMENRGDSTWDNRDSDSARDTKSKDRNI